MIPCFSKLPRTYRAPIHGLHLLFVVSTFLVMCSACSNGNCQLLDTCTAATDCGPGQSCGNCPAMLKFQSICVRSRATLPTSIINGLPFNKYSWLMTHNSFSFADAPPLPGVKRFTFYNQEDSVTDQLRNGVRGLMLDMYDYKDDIWLCHSTQGKCFSFTAFEPAINTLKEVEAFLSQNPSEIVTIIIEDYVHTPKGLTKLFTDAGLLKYWFPVSKMPAKGEDWPTVTDMVQANHRLLVFTNIASKEADEGIAYQWRYMVENEPGDGGVKRGSCSNRKESQPLNSRSASLFLQNYFPTFPVKFEACKEHSSVLDDLVGTCYNASGNVMPNFLAVNFYKRSDGGGAFDVLDKMNGQTLCGSSSITACKAGAPIGSCKNTSASNIKTTGCSIITTTGGNFSGNVQLKGYASTAGNYPNSVVLFLVYFLPMLFFLS